MTGRTPPYIPPEGPPRGLRIGPGVFDRLGEDGVRAIIHDLYVELRASKIAHLFGGDLEESVDRSAAFFIGLLGGPPRYVERYGPPAMRARHLRFPIDEAARREWLACFERVLERAPERHGFPEEDLPDFRRFLDGFSRWMVNRDG